MMSPLAQFRIEPMAPLSLSGFNVMFTNSALMMVLGVVLSVGFLMFASRRAALVPDRLQGFAEMSYEFIANLIGENTGPEGMKFFPFVFTIFTFVFMGNIMGMMPFAFTYTSHAIVTFSLSFLVIGLVIAVGLLRHGFKFFSLFFPAGVPWYIMPLLVPVEIISFCVRPFSLGMRLFLNMMAGHMVMKIFAGFIIMMVGFGGLLSLSGLLPFAINFAIVAFEFFIAAVQAYIFAIFTCIYLRDAIYLHGHDEHH